MGGFGWLGGAGGGGVLLPEPVGIRNGWPTVRLVDCNPLAAIMASTDTPNFWEILYIESPACTEYVV